MLEEATESANKSTKPTEDRAPSTRRESSGSLLGKKGCEKQNKSRELPLIKNVGFVNEKWTEIPVDNEAESDEMDRDEIKKAIIQMSKREEHNPLDNWTDRFIRVNHKTYVPVHTTHTNRKAKKSALKRKFVHPANPIAKIMIQQQRKSSRWNIYG